MPVKANWNYPTIIWAGPGRIAELPAACALLGIRRPLLVTDKGLVFVHHYNFVGTNWAPFAKLHVAERAASLRGGGPQHEAGCQRNPERGAGA